ncbi:PTS system, glucose/glucoside family, IIBC component [Clostridium polyendosporum]|uniref:PTS system, glucose/glucoside family, IIBC component n=1 Tax=Clostridium polyendosporum TaxID=69208 RepID=A0A919S1W9_9CLOT|nr:PTS transporter subunit EIIC [Clostridium polyendosporum]GIM30597.1 PTS system, glucose/glucoside family, IIBC component [Clostridium polyendosporum]
MKDKVVNGMQIFARSVVVPVLFLPIAGIILALSSILSNPTIVGNGSFLINVGKFIGSGLWPILINLGIVFCVGIAMGMAKEKKAEAALIALFSFLIFLGANNQWLTLTEKLVPYKVTSDLYGTGQTVILGFQVIDMGVFLGMILGVVVALVHNKFCNKEFSGAFGAYGNTKLVFMVLVPILLTLAVVLSYVWPVVASGITALTSFINMSGSIGVFLYGFLNRFLIPTGLHHLINTPFLYSNIGGELAINGKTYFGAVNIFLAQLTDPSVKMFDPSAKYLQYGMVKIFGLVGAALAFYKTAKPENKIKLKAILIPAVATSVLAGITEPLEFTFLFVSPFLWLVHSAMDGLFEAVTVLLGARTYGPGGLIDFVAYNLPAGIGRTRWPIFIAVGLVQLPTYFFIFRFLIQKLNLKTPGREDNEVKLYTKKDYKDKTSKGSGEVAADKGSDLAAVIVQGLGGKGNIETVDNCFSRLRVKVTDASKVDEPALKGTGASGVIKNGNNIQVVYGPKVNGVRNSVDKYLAV